MARARNYPMCKNSTGYNRTRNFGLYGHAESKKTQKFVFRSALRPNQISFSHDQNPIRTWTAQDLRGAHCRTARRFYFVHFPVLMNWPTWHAWSRQMKRREFITLL